MTGKYDELIKGVLKKSLCVVERKDVPGWYLRLNDMIANSPLMKEIREKAKE